MSLYDEIMDAQDNRVCKFGKIIAELDPEDRAGLEAALANPGITRISVVNVLTKRGLAVDRDTMTRHLRGKCVCHR